MRRGTMTRRGFLTTTAAMTAGVAMAAAGDKTPRPNILLITTDQQHWMARGAADPFFVTPAMDALARSGIVFDHAFCTTPQCSASRASLYTGLYPHNTSVITNIDSAIAPDKEQQPLPARFETIGSRLRAAGYRTAYFGKWHLGNDDHYATHFDRAALDSEPHTRATEKAIAAMQDWAAAPEKPFCICVNYINPHDVYDFVKEAEKGNVAPTGGVPHPSSWSETFENKPSPQQVFAEEEQGRFLKNKPDALWEAYREFYRDKVRLADVEIGRLLEHLDRSGLRGNTVVLFTADHGDMDTHHRLVFKGPFMYENLVRIPFVMRMPGVTPATVDRFVTPCDVLPTLCALAGAEAGTTDGISLAAGLAGGPYPDRDFVVGQYHAKQKWVNPIRMHRTREWKYNRYLVHGEELYDLKNDPEEMVNLAANPAYTARKAELSAALDHWMANNGDSAFANYRPTHRDGTRFEG